MSVAAYARQLRQLLPPGRLWNLAKFFQRTNYILDSRPSAFNLGTGVTRTLNAAPAPDGSITAAKFAYDGSGASNGFRFGDVSSFGSTAVGTNYAGSLYLRSDSITPVNLSLNVNSGVVVTIGASWQRVIAAGPSQNTSAVHVDVYGGGSNAAVNVYAWHAQLELGLDAGPVIPTSGAPATIDDANSTLSRVLLAIATELSRADDRAINLLDEWDPRTATEMLEDWERILGIPEPGRTLSSTTTGRRADITAKFAGQGGQTPAYFIAVANSLGFDVAIALTGPSAWRLDVFALTSTSTDHAALEVTMNRIKPAHTTLAFNYVTGTSWDVGGVVWDQSGITWR